MGATQKDEDKTGISASAQEAGSLERLVRGYLHDINNFLTTIGLTLELLRRPDMIGSEDIRSRLERIYNYCLSAERLINDVRDRKDFWLPCEDPTLEAYFSAMDSLIMAELSSDDESGDGLKLKRYLKTIPELSELAIAIARRMREPRDYRYEYFRIDDAVKECVCKHLPGRKAGYEKREARWVYTDRTKLSRSVINLLSNAAKAVAAAKKEYGGDERSVRVSVREADVEECRKATNGSDISPGRNYVISVSDDGIGIPDENIREIFKQGYTTGGRGEGLVVVDTFCRMYGGGVMVKTRVGKGSTFDLYVPVTEEAEKLPHVLLVDDDPNVLDSAGGMLARIGYHVSVAATIRGARRHKKGGVKVVVADTLTSEGMSGMGVIKNFFPDSQFISISGDEKNPEMMERHGIHFFVPKPIAIEQLDSAILAALNYKA